MPLFTFRCSVCERTAEVLHISYHHMLLEAYEPNGDPHRCSVTCGGKMQRVISAAAFSMRGMTTEFKQTDKNMRVSVTEY